MEGQGRERRGSAPTWDAEDSRALHERQHDLQFNHPTNLTKVRPLPIPKGDQSAVPPANSSEGGGHEVTGTPYDPNLTCVICQKMFRIGEIQRYRTHTENCVGTLV